MWGGLHFRRSEDSNAGEPSHFIYIVGLFGMKMYESIYSGRLKPGHMFEK